MMNNKYFLFFAVIIGAGSFSWGVASADGGVMIWPPTIQVRQTDQNAIVAWNGAQELMVLSTNYEKPAVSQAVTLLHVVPLPSQPADIKEEDPAVFDKLTTLLNQKITAMQTKNMNWGGTTGIAGSGAAQDSIPSVEIVAQKTIGAHDVTVVKVNVADDFSNWIDGFASGKNLAQKQISVEFKNGLQSYLKRGINYFVFDVVDMNDQKTAVKPLIYQFDTKYFYFPLLISGISEIGASQANVNLFLVFNKNWKLPAQIWPELSISIEETLHAIETKDYSILPGYNVNDSKLDIDLTLDELKGISERSASIFNDGVKVRRFSVSGKLSNMEKDLMLFPRIFSNNLKTGMTNNDVKMVQQLLINEGFWTSPASVTGYFGPATKQAVMRFQQKYSDQILKPLGLIAPTGFFGPYTRNYLNNNLFIDTAGSQTILCGNGKCDPGETTATCSQDCK